MQPTSSIALDRGIPFIGAAPSTVISNRNIRRKRLQHLNSGKHQSLCPALSQFLSRHREYAKST